MLANFNFMDAVEHKNLFKEFLLGLIILFSSACNHAADAIPRYQELKKVFDRNSLEYEKFYVALSESNSELRLKFIDGELNYKTEATDQWSDSDQSIVRKYSQLMSVAGMIFGGRVNERVYIGAGSYPQKERKILLAEFRKSLKGSSEYNSCTADMFSNPKGACDISLNGEWYIHYGWVTY